VSKLETILQTQKDESETWGDVLKRLDSAGQLDFKLLTKLVIYLLDKEEDGQERTDTGVVAREYDLGTEVSGLQQGITGSDGEISPDIKDTADDNTSGQPTESPISV